MTEMKRRKIRKIIISSTTIVIMMMHRKGVNSHCKTTRQEETE